MEIVRWRNMPTIILELNVTRDGMVQLLFRTTMSVTNVLENTIKRMIHIVIIASFFEPEIDTPRVFDLKQTDYKGWAKGLKKAGYATNPKYADLIIRIIEENELDKYDKLKKLPDTEVIAEVETPEFKSDVPTILNVRSVKVSDNNIKYVVAKQGDTPASIAKQNDMGLWQILKYNDLEKHDPIMSGDIVYLQPKRNYASSEFPHCCCR